MALPYLAVAVPATITKWLLFQLVIRRVARPTALRLLAVGIAEPICFYASLTISVWLGITGLMVLAIYPVLALFPNLLLVPSVNRESPNWPLKRILIAFALGLVFLLWLFPVGFALSALIGHVLTSNQML